MIDPAVHAARRAQLSNLVDAPILLVGQGERSRNLRMNSIAFRQDSNFLYFTGCTNPDAAVLIAGGHSTLFLPPPEDGDALWHGSVESIEDAARRLGFDDVKPAGYLEAACAPLAGALATLAVPDHRRNGLASRLAGLDLEIGRAPGTDALVGAVISMRRTLDEHELSQVRLAASVTQRAHRAAMAATRPGINERHIAALFDGILAAAGMVPAYGTIATVRGEVLHNPHHHNLLADGQLFLLDGGAEAPSGYASDVTRTWPVSGRFTERQRSAYDAVLEAERTAIDLVRAGTRYRDVHFAAALVIARFLADEKLIRCAPEVAVEAGAHAMFFPHGTGHLVGLDVHDLEDFGDRATYGPGRPRSDQFGTRWLRIDLDLVPGMVVTIEPGFYVVPAILAEPGLRARFGDMVDLDRAARWAGFGGIRIEDDVLVTKDAPDVITAGIPKEPDAVAALVGTGSLTLPA